MAMGRNSIMVGKSYRTPDDEIRTVQSIDNGEVVFRAASGATPAMIEHAVDQKLSLEDFAAEVDGEGAPGV
jgi:hypothetical protein